MSTTPHETESRFGTEGPVRVTAGRPAPARRAGGPTNLDFLRTSEFLVLAVLSVAILIAGAVADAFDAKGAWTLVAVLGAAYIVSRGLAKLGRGRDDDGVV